MIFDVDAYILAGGKSERMGKNKAFLPWHNTTVIEFLYNNLKTIFEEVYVVTKNRDLFSSMNLKVVYDRHLDYSAIVGIYAALTHSNKSHIFIKACDNPVFFESLIYDMYKRLSDYDVVIPKTDDGFHPLFGFYSKKCLDCISNMISNHNYRIINLYEKVKTYFLTESDIAILDREKISLKNLNTPEDFQEFKKHYEGDKHAYK